MMAPQEQQTVLREVAHRLFASEFNASTVELKGDDERSPAYVLSPLGAKVNRLFVVGVLTEVQNIGQDGREMWRARISDPTGLFTVYAGEYQPEASQALAAMEAPCYVAVVGKARTYEPEPGQKYMSIRPETITEVDETTRDAWILQATEHTYARLKAVERLGSGEATTAEDLVEAGFHAVFAEGAALAVEHYGKVDLEPQRRMLLDTLHYLHAGETVPVHEAPAQETRTTVPSPKAEDLAPDGDEALEKFVLETVERLLESNPDGAPWDDIIDAGTKAGNGEDAVEDALNALIDRGLVYEPILGKLKLA